MYVVLTSPSEDSQKIVKKIEKFGIDLFFYPTISFQKKTLIKKEKKLLDVNSFDWVIFTSKNGVRFFMENLGNVKFFKGKKICVIGTETARELKKWKLKADFYPTVFDTKNLAKGIPIKPGVKILLPRSDIADQNLVKNLIKRGAQVANIPVYKTELVNKPNPEFEEKLLSGEVGFILFSSPSTARGLIQNLSNKKIKVMVLKCSAISIGPTTSRALKKMGFENIYTAKNHTIEGMLKRLREVII